MNAVNHPEEVADIVRRGRDVTTHGWRPEKIEHLGRRSRD